MYTDLSGFSRQVAEFGIIHFLQTIYESFQLFGPVIEEHGGILLKVEGDSLLMIFRNVDEVVKCAVEMQHTAQRHNESPTPAEKVLLCVGIGSGGEPDRKGAHKAGTGSNVMYGHSGDRAAAQRMKAPRP